MKHPHIFCNTSCRHCKLENRRNNCKFWNYLTHQIEWIPLDRITLMCGNYVLGERKPRFETLDEILGLVGVVYEAN